MMLHDPRPDVPGFTWTHDDGTQPTPAWMPAIFRADDAGVTVTTMDRDRVSFRIRAGKNEPDAKTGQTGESELSADDAHRVLFALGAGTSKEKSPLGLVTGGKTVLRMTGADAHAALVASPDGRLSIVPTLDPSTQAAHADAVEVPWLFDGEKTYPAHGAHAALGIAEDGRVFIAQGDPAKLTDALKHAGCKRAVALARSTAEPVLFSRSGTADPPRSFYDETVLYGLAVPMKPRGFKFTPENPIPYPVKKGDK
jgi:hypothetical protein